MYIAVVGCAHGELDAIYETVLEAEKYSNKKIDLLICCGDFQAVRNMKDLSCLACPDKYKEIGSFSKYYSGEKVAPTLTLFIGGNHEASNHLGELFYGGWAAPNIYYLGCAGVVNIGGLRIAGMSGIYKNHDYYKGHYEKPPFTQQTVRSIYHIRNLEVFRLKQLTGKIDIFLSHDWPSGINQYGDGDRLIKMKPHFKEEIDRNEFGNPPAMELLELHRPSYWFAAHMHCKFPALVPEKDGPRITKFISLDKCLPKRKFLQFLEIEHDKNASMDLHYDLEWLSILYFTNHLLSVKPNFQFMPTGQDSDKDFLPSEEEKNLILKKFNNDLKIPKNFYQSVESYNCDAYNDRQPASLITNDQTTKFCNTLGIDDPFTLLKLMQPNSKNCDNKSSPVSENSPMKDTSFENSFVSDSILESFNSDSVQSVIEKFSIDREGSYKSNLSPLKLPAASNKSFGSDDEEENLSKRSIEAIEGDEQQEEKSIEINESNRTTPTLKKFKRRNQSIYAESY